jgi:hypothetical protein
MSDPVFKIGDIIEFELRQCSKILPRWNHSTDYGGSGVWQEGKVVENENVGQEEVFCTEYFISGQRNTWHWAMPKYVHYDKDQWSRPGFLRHKEQVKQRVTRLIFCNDHYETRLMEK